MNNYLILVRAQISTVMKVSAANQHEASDMAQKLFEAAHTPNVDMVLAEVLPHPEQTGPLRS